MIDEKMMDLIEKTDEKVLAWLESELENLDKETDQMVSIYMHLERSLNKLKNENRWQFNFNAEREENAIPAAKNQGMGIMIMKVIRPIENDSSLDPKDMIRYALSLDGVNGVVLGTDSKEVVDANVALLKDFTPMTKEELTTMTSRLNPFFNHQGTPWMEPGYQDGHWT